MNGRQNGGERIIVLFGPTGAGKTELLPVLFDDRFEVLNADSMQAYRHLQIGAAAPSAELRARVPHHLVSFLEPNVQYNAGAFVKKADILIREIIRRGKHPVICGGTAFYIRSFLCGLPESPAGSAETRERLRTRQSREGQSALYKQLVERDPMAAQRIPPADRYRTIRALEILEATGRSVYSFQWPRSPRKDFRFLILGLERPREALYARIARRVDRMFEQGLVREVRGLVSMGFHARDPGMQGIGYREFFQMMKGCLTLEETRELIKQDTRRYAKRQMTFFRSMPDVIWLDPDDPAAIRLRIESFLRAEANEAP